MSMDAEALRKYYGRLPDAEIARLSNCEAKELLPEALPVLKEEIKRRRLSDDLNVAIDIQLRGVTHTNLVTAAFKHTMSSGQNSSF